MSPVKITLLMNYSVLDVALHSTCWLAARLMLAKGVLEVHPSPVSSMELADVLHKIINDKAV